MECHLFGTRARILVDYRVYVDGARVGGSAPGQTLLIGLTPGPHTIQGRSLGGSGPVLQRCAGTVPVSFRGPSVAGSGQFRRQPRPLSACPNQC